MLASPSGVFLPSLSSLCETFASTAPFAVVLFKSMKVSAETFLTVSGLVTSTSVSSGILTMMAAILTFSGSTLGLIRISSMWASLVGTSRLSVGSSGALQSASFFVAMVFASFMVLSSTMSMTVGLMIPSLVPSAV